MAQRTVVLVSPDGKQKRKVEVDSKEDINLRWDGYLPEKQQAAPRNGEAK